MGSLGMGMGGLDSLEYDRIAQTALDQFPDLAQLIDDYVLEYGSLGEDMEISLPSYESGPGTPPTDTDSGFGPELDFSSPERSPHQPQWIQRQVAPEQPRNPAFQIQLTEQGQLVPAAAPVPVPLPPIPIPLVKNPSSGRSRKRITKPRKPVPSNNPNGPQYGNGPPLPPQHRYPGPGPGGQNGPTPTLNQLLQSSGAAGAAAAAAAAAGSNSSNNSSNSIPPGGPPSGANLSGSSSGRPSPYGPGGPPYENMNSYPPPPGHGHPPPPQHPMKTDPSSYGGHAGGPPPPQIPPGQSNWPPPPPNSYGQQQPPPGHHPMDPNGLGAMYGRQPPNQQGPQPPPPRSQHPSGGPPPGPPHQQYYSPGPPPMHPGYPPPPQSAHYPPAQSQQPRYAPPPSGPYPGQPQPYPTGPPNQSPSPQPWAQQQSGPGGPLRDPYGPPPTQSPHYNPAQRYGGPPGSRDPAQQQSPQPPSQYYRYPPPPPMGRPGEQQQPHPYHPSPSPGMNDSSGHPPGRPPSAGGSDPHHPHHPKSTPPPPQSPSLLQQGQHLLNHHPPSPSQSPRLQPQPPPPWAVVNSAPSSNPSANSPSHRPASNSIGQQPCYGPPDVGEVTGCNSNDSIGGGGPLGSSSGGGAGPGIRPSPSPTGSASSRSMSPAVGNQNIPLPPRSWGGGPEPSSNSGSSPSRSASGNNPNTPSDHYRSKIKKADSMHKLYEMDESPDRRHFLDKLLGFMDEIGSPIQACPQISKHPLDLFKLYIMVKERGGFLEVTRNKTWKDIAGSLGIGASSSAAYTLRKHYTKHILPFECKFDRGGIDPAPLILQVDQQTGKKKGPAPKSGPSNSAGGSGSSSTGLPVPSPGSSNSQDSFPGPNSNSNTLPPSQQNSMDSFPGSGGGYPSPYPGQQQGGELQYTGTVPSPSRLQGPGPPPPGPPNSGEGTDLGIGKSGSSKGNVWISNPFDDSAVGPNPNLTFHQQFLLQAQASNRSNNFHNPSSSGSSGKQIPNSGPPLQNSQYPPQLPLGHPAHRGYAGGPPPPQNSTLNQLLQSNNSAAGPGSPSPGSGGPPQNGANPSAGPYRYDQHPLNNNSSFKTEYPPGPLPQQQWPPQDVPGGYPPRGGPGPYYNGPVPHGQYPPPPGPPPGQQYRYPGPPQDGPRYPPPPQSSGPGPHYGPPPPQIPQSPQQQPPWSSSPRPEVSPGPQQPSVSQSPQSQGSPPWASNWNHPRPPGPIPGPPPRSMPPYGPVPGKPSSGPYPSQMSNSNVPPSGPSPLLPPPKPMMNSQLAPINQLSAMSPPVLAPPQVQVPQPPPPQPQPPQLKKEISFPPDSVESVQPVSRKRKKLSRSDVCPVEAWRLMMSLKSGLLAETTWALDVLNVLLYDDLSVSYFSLNYLPGLLDLLLEHLRRSLVLMFGPSGGLHEWDECLLEDGHDEPLKSISSSTSSTSPPKWYERKSEHSSSAVIDIGSPVHAFPLLRPPIQRLQILSGPNYTSKTRITAKPIKIIPANSQPFILPGPRDWDIDEKSRQSPGAESQIGAGGTNIMDLTRHVISLDANGTEMDLVPVIRILEPKSHLQPQIIQVPKIKVESKSESNNENEPAEDLNEESLNLELFDCPTKIFNPPQPPLKLNNLKKPLLNGLDGLFKKSTLASSPSPSKLNSLNQRIKDTSDFVNSIRCEENTLSEAPVATIKTEPCCNGELGGGSEDSSNSQSLELESTGSSECNNTPVSMATTTESAPVSMPTASAIKIRTPGNSTGKRRRKLEDYEDECLAKDEPSLGLVTSAQDSLARRTLSVLNILRSLTFVPGNDLELGKNLAFLNLIGKLLLLHHEHPVRNSAKADSQSMILAVPEDEDLAAASLAATAAAEIDADSCTSLALPDSDPWWWDYLHHIREHVLVILANISGQVDLGPYSEEISRPILDGLLHWATCPAAYGQDSFPLPGTLSPRNLALEALCKLSVTQGNVDLLLATPPYSRIEKLCGLLSLGLVKTEDQVTREFSLNLLSYLSSADSGIARTIATQGPSISLLISYIEQHESNARSIVENHGFSILRENPEAMGTSLDMLRRAASTLLNLAKHPDNRPLFVQHEPRLLSLVMSQILEQKVAGLVAQVLFTSSAPEGGIGGGKGGSGTYVGSSGESDTFWTPSLSRSRGPTMPLNMPIQSQGFGPMGSGNGPAPPPQIPHF